MQYLYYDEKVFSKWELINMGYNPFQMGENKDTLSLPLSLSVSRTDTN